MSISLAKLDLVIVSQEKEEQFAKVDFITADRICSNTVSGLVVVHHFRQVSCGVHTCNFLVKLSLVTEDEFSHRVMENSV